MMLSKSSRIDSVRIEPEFVKTVRMAFKREMIDL